MTAASQRLTADLGRGFDRTNIQQMRAFYLAYQIRDALRPELSWTHYRLLLRVERPEARAFYQAEAVNARWSTRELERQIHSLAICPRKRNLRPKCSASGKPSRWKADFGKKRPMNNPQRFPSDLRFPLSDEEFENWRSQIVTSNSAAKMGLRRRPYAFAEQGVAMLSSVLNSDRAIEVNMAIMRAFVRLRKSCPRTSRPVVQ